MPAPGVPRGVCAGRGPRRDGRAPRKAASSGVRREATWIPPQVLDADRPAFFPFRAAMWKSRSEAAVAAVRRGRGSEINSRALGQARSSGGERYLDAVEVGGSNPPAPTIPPSRGDCGREASVPAVCGPRPPGMPRGSARRSPPALCGVPGRDKKTACLLPFDCASPTGTKCSFRRARRCPESPPPRRSPPP